MESTSPTNGEPQCRPIKLLPEPLRSQVGLGALRSSATDGVSSSHLRRRFDRARRSFPVFVATKPHDEQP